MSWNTPKLRPYIAGADLSAKQYHFVKAGPNPNEVVAVTGLLDKPLGILMNDPVQGDSAEVAKLGGGAKLKMSGPVSVGDYIKTTANGQGAVTALDGDDVFARAEKAGVINDVVEVERVDRQI